MINTRTVIISATGLVIAVIAVVMWSTNDKMAVSRDASIATAAAIDDGASAVCVQSTENGAAGSAPLGAPVGMSWIEGGVFAMGSQAAYREEAPVRDVTVDGFWIDTLETTNAAFAQFVDETGYVTVAERTPNPDEIPGAPPEMLKPGSAMFRQPASLMSREILQWWIYMPGANWRHPQGPDSSIEGRMHYPVVHIAFEDAQAYADWAGRSLPTEAQWELAARSRSDGSTYAWGEERVPEGKHMANTWQGIFPIQNTSEDGYVGASPVGCFPPNAYGVYDLIGNVWEWTADYYAPGHDTAETMNPQGPPAEQSHDPRQPGFAVRVIKGGSFLCAPNYCMRYRPSARQAQDTGLGSDHIGFRTALNL